MKIRTFYARTMAEALVEIKSTLGPDALILSTKPIARRSGLGSTSGFQVVAATDPKPDGQLDGIVDTASISSLPGTAVREESHADEICSPAAAESCDSEPDDEGAAALPAASATRTSANFENITAQRLQQELLANDVERGLADALVQQGLRSLAGRRLTRNSLLRAVAAAVQERLQDSPIADGLPPKQLVVFVGPAGVGKTTMIAKLAADLALVRGRKVALFTLDTYRIGAVDQLKTYAGIIGLPFRVAADTDDLRKAVNEHSRRDYILIDTPGRFLEQTGPVSDMMQFLQSTGRCECHLVLSADAKPADLRRMVQWYESCKPDFLAFTKLDQTMTLGPILNELVRTRKALSYYSDGQTVPDDLHSGPREQVVELVLNANSNGATTWKDSADMVSHAASTKTEAKSRRSRKTARKPSPAALRRRKTPAHASLR